MCSDRIDCPCIAVATETQRVVMLLLLTEAPGPWSRDELQREVSGSKGEQLDVDDAINALYGAGLIHVSGELISPTRAARLMDDLRL